LRDSREGYDETEVTTNDPAQLPQDERAERGLIDSAMQESEILDSCGYVKPTYFFRAQHRVIWQTMQEMRAAQHAIDHITLMDALRTNGKLEDAGGELLVYELGSRVTHSMFAPEYARIVCEKYLSRCSLRGTGALAPVSTRGDPQEIASAWALQYAEIQELTAALGISPDGADGSRFRLKGIAEVIKQPPIQWIIPGFLQERKLWLLYGDSNTGKSFVALDMGLSLACGLPWHGRTVRQGAVVYVCAEGMDGISGRLRAWLEFHHVAADIPDFHIIDTSPNLLDPVDVASIIAEIKQRLDDAPLMVVFDTLAASMPGADENSSEGMGMALSSMRRIQRECGCGVMLVHHSGKDRARGPRGHSSLRGAFDAALEVTADEETGLMTLHADKGRDFNKRDARSTMGFRLREVAVGEYGDFTSCILEALDEPPASDTSRVRRKPTASDRLLTLMQEINTPQIHGILCTAFIKAGYGKRTSFNRALQDLYDRRLIECVNGLYRVISEPSTEGD